MIQMLRRHRFVHHRADYQLQLPRICHQEFQHELSTPQMICHEPPPRTRSAPTTHRCRTYVRTATPYDTLMWQRGLLPQFWPRFGQWLSTKTKSCTEVQLIIVSCSPTISDIRMYRQSSLRSHFPSIRYSDMRPAPHARAFTLGISADPSLPRWKTHLRPERYSFLHGRQWFY